MKQFILLAVSFVITAQAYTKEPETIGKSQKTGYLLGLKKGFNQSVNFFAGRPVAYMPTQGQIEVLLQYEQMNESLDILDVKEKHRKDGSQELLDFSGNVGDLEGFGFIQSIGLTQRFSLHSKLRRSSLEYGSGNVSLEDQSLGFKWLLHKEARVPQLALEIQFRSVRGSGFKDRFTHIRVENANVLLDNEQETSSSMTVLKFKEQQTVEFGGLRSDSHRVRLLLSKQVARRHFGHFFLGYQHIDSRSEISLSLGAFDQLEDMVRRKQEVSTLGIGWDWNIHTRWALHVDLQAMQVRRSPELESAVKDNNLVQAGLLFQLTPQSKLHLQAQYFSHFFAGEIPFLLNEKNRRNF